MSERSFQKLAKDIHKLYEGGNYDTESEIIERVKNRIVKANLETDGMFTGGNKHGVTEESLSNIKKLADIYKHMDKNKYRSIIKNEEVRREDPSEKLAEKIEKLIEKLETGEETEERKREEKEKKKKRSVSFVEKEAKKRKKRSIIGNEQLAEYQPATVQAQDDYLKDYEASILALRSFKKDLIDQDDRNREYKKKLNSKVRKLNEKMNKHRGGFSVGGAVVAGAAVGGKIKKEKKPMTDKQREWFKYVEELRKLDEYRDMPRTEVMKIAAKLRKKGIVLG